MQLGLHIQGALLGLANTLDSISASLELPSGQVQNPDNYCVLQEARKLLHNVPVVTKDWVEACMQRHKQVRYQNSRQCQQQQSDCRKACRKSCQSITCSVSTHGAVMVLPGQQPCCNMHTQMAVLPATGVYSLQQLCAVALLVPCVC